MTFTKMEDGYSLCNSALFSLSFPNGRSRPPSHFVIAQPQEWFHFLLPHFELPHCLLILMDLPQRKYNMDDVVYVNLRVLMEMGSDGAISGIRRT